ncbi:MAG: penicillin-binding protein 2 [Nitrospirota bacterium]
MIDVNRDNREDIIKRIKYLSIIVAVFFLIFTIRIWHLQILKGKHYRNLSENNRVRVIKTIPPRGILYDRNSIPIVNNIPSFDVTFSIEDTYTEERIEETIKTLGFLLNIPEEDIKKKIANYRQSKPFEPVRVKENITWKEVAMIEARRSDLLGVSVEATVKRDYLYGDIGGHLLGYLGRITPEQSKDHEYRNLPSSIAIGQWGIERTFDRALRGTPGNRMIEVNAIGQEIRMLSAKEPEKGNDIHLTIDIKTQKAAEEALGKHSGAIVAMDPMSGEILALVSRPGFDPNQFSKGISRQQWQGLLNHQDHPLTNRATQGLYPPGSTFKIIVAAAGLDTGIIDPSWSVRCQGSIRFGGRDYRCWKKEGHGIVSLHRAIVESCDVYFYELGRKLGVDRIAEYANKFGLGMVTGISANPENAGVIPSTSWKKKIKGERWFYGETLSVSIGQGYISVTPLQMAVALSAFVNGGKIYKPRIVRNENIESRDVHLNDIEVLDFIRQSLQDVVEAPEGTGRAAQSKITTIGGKTGTSQVIGIQSGKPLSHLRKFADHAWFIAFAPVDSPSIVVSVLVEHGRRGGTTAAPIAKKVIEAYIESNKNKAVQ